MCICVHVYVCVHVCICVCACARVRAVELLEQLLVIVASQSQLCD